jgi:hypothetical protein
MAATKRFSKADPWRGLFLKSECVGFQISPASGGNEAPKGRYMKSDLTDFIADSSETSPWVGSMGLLRNLIRRRS